MREALPNGDLWARALWLEREFNVESGSLMGQYAGKQRGKGKGVGSRDPKEAKALDRQRQYMKDWISSSEDSEESEGDDPLATVAMPRQQKEWLVCEEEEAEGDSDGAGD